MTLIRRLRCVARLMDVVTTQDSLIVAQRTLISQMREQLDRQALSHVRELQWMTAAWLIHHESPDSTAKNTGKRRENLGRGAGKMWPKR